MKLKLLNLFLIEVVPEIIRGHTSPNRGHLGSKFEIFKKLTEIIKESLKSETEYDLFDSNVKMS